MLLAFLSMLLPACNNDLCTTERPQRHVSDPEARLVIGGTYADALATIVGERSGTLEWISADAHVDGLPASGQTRIMVTVDEPYSARENTWRPGRTNRNEEEASCRDLNRLIADLFVDLESDDGFLDATLDVRATFSSPEAATISVDVEDESLGDMFGVPNEPAARLSLALDFIADGHSGGRLILHSPPAEDTEDQRWTQVDLAVWALD